MSFLIFVLAAAFFLIFSLYIKERKAFLLYKKFFSHVSKLLGEKGPTPPLYLVEKLKKRFESLEEEIKRAERSRDNILTILNNLTDPIFILSKDGVIIFANDAAKSITRENVVKRKFYEVVEDYFINEMVDEAIKTLETQVGDIVLYLNQKRYFHAKVIPVSFKDGERMFIVMLHDVTKEKKLDEMRREFVSNVSHELRTPLTSIHGFAETLLEDDLSDRNLVKKFLRVIEEESARMTRLINDLLDLEKLESGEAKFHFEEVDLCEIVDYIKGIMIPLAEEYSVQMETSCENITVWGDRDRIIQMLLNLVDNAVKYTSTKDKGEKKVWIRVRKEGEEAVIEVEDTGPGIPQEAKNRIFERFYRVDKARSRKMGGTGLGLSIVKMIVDKHGGEIEVESEVGKGTLMRIRFPVKEVEE